MPITKRENPITDHPFEQEDLSKFNYIADPTEQFDDFDSNDEGFSFSDVDFSDFGGNFKENLKKLDHRVTVLLNNRKAYNATGNRLKKKINKLKKPVASKITIPSDKEIIIRGANNMILSRNPAVDASKAIGYYKGRKLNMLTLTFNNNSANDFNIRLFDPSAPLDYFFSNGLNVNDKIQVAGGSTSYSNMLFNLLANPTMIVSAQIYISGTVGDNAQRQINESLIFVNQNIAGLQAVEPLNINLQRDIMQRESTLVTFEIMKQLKRPFVPDGMDVIQYSIFAGNTVTMNFYYKQIQIKRMVFDECRQARNLL